MYYTKYYDGPIELIIHLIYGVLNPKLNQKISPFVQHAILNPVQNCIKKIDTLQFLSLS